MRLIPVMIPVSEVTVGDMLDLEGDAFADPKHDNIALEHEVAVVLEIKHKAPDCIALYCDGIACGFPPDHMVKLLGHDNEVTPCR